MSLAQMELHVDVCYLTAYAKPSPLPPHQSARLETLVNAYLEDPQTTNLFLKEYRYNAKLNKYNFQIFFRNSIVHNF